MFIRLYTLGFYETVCFKAPSLSGEYWVLKDDERLQEIVWVAE